MDVGLPLSPSELTSTIEALHDGILRRLRWTTVEHPSYGTWRNLDIETVQTVLDTMVSAYSKAMMAYRTAEFPKLERFEDRFMLADEVWDMLAMITIAEKWDDIEYHPVHDTTDGCPICGAIAGIA